MCQSGAEKENLLLMKRFAELSRITYQRDIVTYTDFLNLNEQNTLHTLPKDRIFAKFILFGGYGMAERRMAAFIPDALYLRCGKDEILPKDLSYPYSMIRISPLYSKFSEELSHRDYLGAILNLGIERSKTGDILTYKKSASVFLHRDLADFVCSELIRIRHTQVSCEIVTSLGEEYVPAYERITGSVASVRLDSLLTLAFPGSRSKLSGLISAGKVYVNGRLVMSNGFRPEEGDRISVRGMGKFCYVECGAFTRKKRQNIVIHKYM